MHAVGRMIAYIILTILAIASFLSVYGIPLGFLFIWGIYKIRKNSQITDIQHRLRNIQEENQKYIKEQRMRREYESRERKNIARWRQFTHYDDDREKYR